MCNTICIYLKARFTLKARGLPSARTDLCVQQLAHSSDETPSAKHVFKYSL